MKDIFELTTLPSSPNYLAPDTSEIRSLPTFEAGGLCHCTLPVGGVSKPVKHRKVEEIWYCLSGKGVIWQQNDAGDMEKEFSAKDSFTIPAGNSFQFKNTGDEPLCIIISTMPKWPGADEAIDARGKWIK